MEQERVDIYEFISETQLERTEPKNRFREHSAAFNPLLNEIVNDFPHIRDRYNTAFDSYIHNQTDTSQTSECFFTEVYEPILITEAVISEVQKFRNPDPQVFNPAAIRTIVKSLQPTDTNEDISVSAQLVQKAMSLLELTEEEYFRCKVYNICYLELQKLTADGNYTNIVDQLKKNAHAILYSLKPVVNNSDI